MFLDFRKALAMTLLAATFLASAGCGAGSLICRREAIRATLRTPLNAGEDASNDILAGNLESRRDENPELTAIDLAIEGRTLSGRGITIQLQRGLDRNLWVTLRLPTPLRTGAVLPVVEVHSPDRAMWGTFPNPPSGLSVGVRLVGFVASSASGSARVIGLDPLRVDVEVVASDGGQQVVLDGLLNVEHDTWTESCFQ